MAYFDRFDICEAYLTLEWDYNVDGALRERQRRGSPQDWRRSVGVQCDDIGFTPRVDLSSDTLTENGREIYDALVSRYKLPVPQEAA